MSEIDMLLWVWLIAGGISLLVHFDQMPKEADAISVLLMLVAWPWWIIHYTKEARSTKRPEDRLAPVRVEVEDRKRRKR